MSVRTAVSPRMDLVMLTFKSPLRRSNTGMSVRWAQRTVLGTSLLWWYRRVGKSRGRGVTLAEVEQGVLGRLFVAGFGRRCSGMR